MKHLSRFLFVQLSLLVVLIGAIPASAQLVEQDAGGLFGSDGLEQQSQTDIDVSVILSADRVSPGGQFVIGVVLDHPGKLHTWPSADQDVLPESFSFAIRTAVTPVGAEGLEFGRTQWPEPHPAAVPNISGDPNGPPTVEVPTYSGRAIVYLPVFVPDDAAGEIAFEIEANYQACDDVQCFIPQTKVLPVRLTVDPEAVSGPFDGDFASFDPANFELSSTSSSLTADPSDTSAASGDVSSGASDTGELSGGGGAKFLGLVSMPAPGSAGFLVITALFGIIGGIVLNLTPCVLPVIPLKIMALSQHAETPGKSVYLGLWMAAGVVGFWLALAVPVLALEQFADPSRLFGVWWVTGGIGMLIAIMAVGLMGAFNITLPQAVYKVNPKADTAWGSFLFGVMTAVLGLPCFGFVIGALLPASANAGPELVLTVFGSIGIGMAAPYLVLSINPAMVKTLPKAGPGSELVKQVIGLLLMAAAAYFIGSGLLALLAEQPHLGKVLHWWVAAFFIVIAGLLLAVRVIQITKKPVPGIVSSLVAVVLGVAGFGVANDQTSQSRERYLSKLEAQAARQDGSFITSGWNEYTPELLDVALASGKTVVVDFTAEWCLNCKALKAAVLSKGLVKERLVAEDTVPITVDLTARTAPGWSYLNDTLGQVGIPTLAIYGPGLPEPWVQNTYTPEQVLAALEQAAGASSASAEGTSDSRIAAGAR